MRAWFAYILLYQALGLNSGAPDRKILRAMKEVEERLRIKMWSWPLFTKNERSRRRTHHRIFFTGPTRERDDAFAARFSENILLLCELFYGPLYPMTDKYYAFPFRFVRFKKRTGIRLASLVREVRSVLDDSHLILVDQLLYQYSVIPDEIVTLALRAAPVLQTTPTLRMATAFISKAQHDFFLFPEQIQEAIYEGDWIPSGAYELAQWEGAFHNSYKAIEAIIGDPPKEDARFRRKLTAMGVDPNEQVGYSKKEPIAKVIREMNLLRDKRVAHGSTPSRGIRLNQMVEFMECAHYVVEQALEQAYGGGLFLTSLTTAAPLRLNHSTRVRARSMPANIIGRRNAALLGSHNSAPAHENFSAAFLARNKLIIVLRPK